MSFAISMILRTAAVLAVALTAARLARRGSASLRAAILASALAVALAMPVAVAVAPVWHLGVVDVPRAPAAGALALPAIEPVVAMAAGAPHAAPTASASALASIPWPAIALAIWLAGIALALARVVGGHLRARAIVRRSHRDRTLAARVAAAWDGADPPVAMISDDLDAPIVVGVVAPVVIVPRSSSAWSAERWRLVLVHELAHVRRRDGVTNLVAQLACCVHWLDPLAWIAARALRRERELAADDAVLRGDTRASTYAEHLLAIAAGTGVGGRASGRAPIAIAMADRQHLEARIVAMLAADRSRSRASAHRVAAIAMTAAALAFVFSCISLSPAAADVRPPHAHATAAIVPALQAAAADELARASAAHPSDGAVALVLDARTGDVLALATRGDGDADAPRTPGSTIKPFTFAAALDAGTIAPDARIDCEQGVRAYGARTLHDASPHGVLDLAQVLAVSSNVGTAQIAEPLGDRLGDALRREHFAVPAHTDTRAIEGAALASGENLGASPLAVATAYTAFANAGVYRDGSGGNGERVMSEATARTMLAMLERVVEDPDGTGGGARVAHARVAGKTGTAGTGVDGRYYASFVGIVPADAPRYVILVGFDGTTASGGEIAAPVFSRLAARALAQ